MNTAGHWTRSNLISKIFLSYCNTKQLLSTSDFLLQCQFCIHYLNFVKFMISVTVKCITLVHHWKRRVYFKSTSLNNGSNALATCVCQHLWRHWSTRSNRCGAATSSIRILTLSSHKIVCEIRVKPLGKGFAWAGKYSAGSLMTFAWLLIPVRKIDSRLVMNPPSLKGFASIESTVM